MVKAGDNVSAAERREGTFDEDWLAHLQCDTTRGLNEHTHPPVKTIIFQYLK